MKTAAYLSDYLGTPEQERRCAETVKNITGADRIIGIMNRHILSDGRFAGKELKTRLETAGKCPVDLVLEMPMFASLSSIGIYAFAVAATIEKLGSADTVVLETENVSLEQLNEAVMLLIANTKEFQEKVAFYKNSGMDFYRAQAKAAGAYIENGEAILGSRKNIFAVECMKAFKVMYSNIEFAVLPESMAEDAGTEQGRLTELLRYQLLLMEEELSDIYGGSDVLTEDIKKFLPEYRDFEQFTKLVAGEHRTEEDIRKYFLHVLGQITKSEISILRMYDFCPYCFAEALTEKGAEELAWQRESNRIPLLTGEPEGEWTERSVKRLYEHEKRLERVYAICR